MRTFVYKMLCVLALLSTNCLEANPLLEGNGWDAILLGANKSPYATQLRCWPFQRDFEHPYPYFYVQNTLNPVREDSPPGVQATQMFHALCQDDVWETIPRGVLINQRKTIECPVGWHLEVTLLNTPEDSEFVKQRPNIVASTYGGWENNMRHFIVSRSGVVKKRTSSQAFDHRREIGEAAFPIRTVLSPMDFPSGNDTTKFVPIYFMYASMWYRDVPPLPVEMPLVLHCRRGEEPSTPLYAYP